MRQILLLIILLSQLSSNTMLHRVTPSLDLSLSTNKSSPYEPDLLDISKNIEVYNESYGETFDRYYNKLPQSYKDSYSDVGYLPAFSFAFLATLWVLPESVSQWNRDEIRNNDLVSLWFDNVQGGAVIDEDKWEVNYIGHTVGGAYYHTLARNNGMTFWQSFLFNFNISTFYWEFGVEAMFEKPSIQDLWITPILGSMLGEVFYNFQIMIRENNGEAFGSKSLGSFLLVFFDPEGALADVLRKFFQTNRDVLDMGFTFKYRYDAYDAQSVSNTMPIPPESYAGFYIKILF